MNRLFALLAAATVLVSACSSTPHKVDSESSVTNWDGKPYKNLLIAGLYDDRAFRISSEITLSDELKSKGIKATPSYEVIPQGADLDDAGAISDATSSKGFDALLAIATTNVNDELTYGDALQTRGWVYLLGGRPGPATNTGILISSLASGTYALHVGLWDTNTQELTWQFTTHSVFQDTPTDEIKSLADLIAEKLRSNGLVQ